ncbi:MAG: DUF922 domain-containing protein [Pseudomonadota bacterium]
MKFFATALGMLILFICYVYFAGVGKPISIEDEVAFYEVDALTYSEMLNQIKTRGPKGHAAVTEWDVGWDWKCRVSLDVKITYPQHTNYEGLSTSQKENWDEFLRRLRLHENYHKYDGIQAARDVSANWCFGARFIVKYWVAQSEILDLRTDHGRTDGVVLKL